MRTRTLIAGTRKGLIQLRRGDDGWRVRSAHFEGIPVTYAARVGGTLWAALDHGHWGPKLQRSADGGATWSEVAAPRLPEGPRLHEGGPEAALRTIWTIAGGGRPGRLYLGTVPGALFRSEDGGESFQLVEGLWNHPSRSDPAKWFGGGMNEPGIHSILVDPRDPRRVLVGVSCAGVFETDDDGSAWRVRNRGLRADFLPEPESEYGHDPHCIARCAADPDVIWMQNHCGLFRSTDGAASWSELHDAEGPGGFGFAVAADPNDPERAWVVPALSDERRMAVGGALCVSTTGDGGRSWRALRRGLPQRDCYDIVYRHALDLSGECLAFGTTTGNLFVSEDRGESWSCAALFLPPIYSLRFDED